jgi:hypothetical protein
MNSLFKILTCTHLVLPAALASISLLKDLRSTISGPVLSNRNDTYASAMRGSVLDAHSKNRFEKSRYEEVYSGKGVRLKWL